MQDENQPRVMHGATNDLRGFCRVYKKEQVAAKTSSPNRYSIASSDLLHNLLASPSRQSDGCLDRARLHLLCGHVSSPIKFTEVMADTPEEASDKVTRLQFQLPDGPPIRSVNIRAVEIADTVERRSPKKPANGD